MKSGFLPKTDKQAADELIAGTDRTRARLAALPRLRSRGDGTADSSPEDEPAMAEA